VTQAQGASALTWVDNSGSGILTKSDLKRAGDCGEERGTPEVTEGGDRWGRN